MPSHTSGRRSSRLGALGATKKTIGCKIERDAVDAEALYADANATLGDLREAVTTFEDLARIARRTLGGAHPLTAQIEQSLQYAREDLRLRTQ